MGVQGDSPDDWEWDGPSETIRPGDKYRVTFSADDPNDTQIKFVKEEEGEELEEEEDDGEEDLYSVTGSFNDWTEDRMEDGIVPFSRTITIEVPDDGVVDFRFIRNGDDSERFGPDRNNCRSMVCKILGPDADLTTSWQVLAEPGSMLRIDLFMYKHHRG